MATAWATRGNLRGPQGIEGPAGTTGPPGTPGADGKTVLNGSGAPNNSLGVAGDFYIDTTNNRLYGPKGASAWPGSYVNLVGPAGAAGAPGGVSVIFRGRASAAQALSASTWTSINFATEDYDTDGAHDATNTHLFTAVRGGYYRVTGMVPFPSNSATYRAARIRKNGVVWPGSQNYVPGSTLATYTPVTVDSVLLLAVGDTVEIQGLTGTAMSTAYVTTANSDIAAMMEVTLVQPTNGPVLAAPAPVAELFTNSAAQTFPYNTWTSWTFDSEAVDTHDGHSLTTNPSRWTCPVGWGGYYAVSGGSYLIQVGGYVHAVRLAKNGTPVRGSIHRDTAITGTDTDSGLTTGMHVIQLTPGDYVEVQALHTNPTARGTFVTAEYGPFLSVAFLRPT